MIQLHPVFYCVCVSVCECLCVCSRDCVGACVCAYNCRVGSCVCVKIQFGALARLVLTPFYNRFFKQNERLSRSKARLCIYITPRTCKWPARRTPPLSSAGNVSEVTLSMMCSSKGQDCEENDVKEEVLNKVWKAMKVQSNHSGALGRGFPISSLWNPKCPHWTNLCCVFYLFQLREEFGVVLDGVSWKLDWKTSPLDKTAQWKKSRFYLF